MAKKIYIVSDCVDVDSFDSTEISFYEKFENARKEFVQLVSEQINEQNPDLTQKQAERQAEEYENYYPIANGYISLTEGVLKDTH